MCVMGAVRPWPRRHTARARAWCDLRCDRAALVSKCGGAWRARARVSASRFFGCSVSRALTLLEHQLMPQPCARWSVAHHISQRCFSHGVELKRRPRGWSVLDRSRLVGRDWEPVVECGIECRSGEDGFGLYNPWHDPMAAASPATVSSAQAGETSVVDKRSCCRALHPPAKNAALLIHQASRPVMTAHATHEGGGIMRVIPMWSPRRYLHGDGVVLKRALCGCIRFRRPLVWSGRSLSAGCGLQQPGPL